jgi:hypothetical protein
LILTKGLIKKKRQKKMHKDKMLNGASPLKQNQGTNAKLKKIKFIKPKRVFLQFLHSLFCYIKKIHLHNKNNTCI